jgi:hypothetical protein
LLAILIAALAVSQAAMGTPSKDNLNVTAKTSSGGMIPTIPGNAQNQWFYPDISVCSGGGLTQTFTLDVSLTNDNGTTPQSTTITLNPTGSLSAYASVSPNGFTVNDDGAVTTVTVTLTIPAAALPDGQYSLIVHVASSDPSKVAIAHDNIHIGVVVGGLCADAIVCYFTSSDFVDLVDCSGNPVSTSSGGTFQIVPNKKKGAAVATNPGQFYYNLLWTNSTAIAQTVTASFAGANLTNTGANSVHALTFAAGFTQDLSAFELVNSDGTPCGPSGPCTITVPAGQTLWVTWHVAWAGIGGSTAGISASCPGNQPISAVGTLTDSLSNVIGTCEADATGYLKPQ